MTRKVEDFFITPLEEHFESQPTEGQRNTILSDMADHTDDVLNDAVEWLKRARQSAKTFPSPKECNKAIAAVLEDRKRPRMEDAPTFSESLTYGQKCKSWAATMKRAVIVHKGTHQWTEWLIYFHAIENEMMLTMMRERESFTLPTQVPSMFDPKYDWAKGDRLLRKWNEERQMLDNPTPDRRRFVAEQLLRIGIRVDQNART